MSDVDYIRKVIASCVTSEQARVAYHWVTRLVVTRPVEFRGHGLLAAVNKRWDEVGR